MSEDTFRVLHVCTGNICRSPMAELLTGLGLRERLGDGGAARFTIRSAGTWGHAGSPMEPHALSTLAGLGVDGASFRAQELGRHHVQAADLVLGATREHRSAAVVMHPKGSAHTFTLREFARLCAAVTEDQVTAEDPVARARELVRAAATKRGYVRAETPDDDDLGDPYQGPASTFVLTAELIRAALARPLDLIAGPRRVAGPTAATPVGAP